MRELPGRLYDGSRRAFCISVNKFVPREDGVYFEGRALEYLNIPVNFSAAFPRRDDIPRRTAVLRRSFN